MVMPKREGGDENCDSQEFVEVVARFVGGVRSLGGVGLSAVVVAAYGRCASGSGCEVVHTLSPGVGSL